MNITVERIFGTAEKNGVSLDFINNLIGGYAGKMDKWRYGKVMPNYQEVSTIANYFNVSLDYLLGNIHTPQPAHRDPSEAAAMMEPPPLESSHVYIVIPGGGKSKITVPPDKAERLRKLIEAAFPELMENEEQLL